MGKRKGTTKKAAKKAGPRSGVNKTQEIKKALAATPNKTPREIAEALTAGGVVVSPGYVSTIKTNMKAKATGPKKVAKKRGPAKKKATRKKRASKAAPATDVTFDQLRMAKEMAQQLGGVENAKEALIALSQLVD